MDVYIEIHSGLSACSSGSIQFIAHEKAIEKYFGTGVRSKKHSMTM